MTSESHAAGGRVEQLVECVRALAAEPTRRAFELWVPEALTLRGAPVPADIAMAVVLDAVLAEGFEPDGFEPGAGGRRYRYVRPGPAA